jgi:hypothetical protein
MASRAVPIPVPVSIRRKKLLASEQVLHYIVSRPAQSARFFPTVPVIDPRLRQRSNGADEPGTSVIAIISNTPIMYGALPMA